MKDFEEIDTPVENGNPSSPRIVELCPDSKVDACIAPVESVTREKSKAPGIGVTRLLRPPRWFCFVVLTLGCLYMIRTQVEEFEKKVMPFSTERQAEMTAHEILNGRLEMMAPTKQRTDFILDYWNGSLKYQSQCSEMCVTRHKAVPKKKFVRPKCKGSGVAVVIPLLGDESPLAHVVGNISAILTHQERCHRIFVVEKVNSTIGSPSGDSVFGVDFNPGALHNAGFLEALREFNFSCIVFHSPYLIPFDLSGNYFLCDARKRFRPLPARIDTNIFTDPESSSYLLPAPELGKRRFGQDSYQFMGVYAMTTRQFLAINGFSNLFFYHEHYPVKEMITDEIHDLLADVELIDMEQRFASAKILEGRIKKKRVFKKEYPFLMLEARDYPDSPNKNAHNPLLYTPPLPTESTHSDSIVHEDGEMNATIEGGQEMEGDKKDITAELTSGEYSWFDSEQEKSSIRFIGNKKVDWWQVSRNVLNSTMTSRQAKDGVRQTRYRLIATKRLKKYTRFIINLPKDPFIL